MEYIATITYTQAELDSQYQGDNLGIHDELTDEFRAANPDAVISVSSGEELDNGDGTFTYELTITYE